MKAIVCTKYGSPDVLKLKDVEKPTPKDNELLIKIHATSVTTGDVRVRGFRVPASFWLPARLALGITKPKKEILGSIFSGEIEKIGKNVKHFKEGDKVFGYISHGFGTYAEYVCVSEKDAVTIKPANLTHEEAAAIPWGGITSLYFLRKGNIKNQDKVLIYGASGSLGTSAIQLAKYFGAEVTGVCSTSNLELVKSLGADKVIDYKKEDFTKNGEKYDIIFDTVGKSNIAKSIKSLKKGGTFLHSIATPAVVFQMTFYSLASGKKLLGGNAVPKVDDLNFIKELAEKGVLKPVIDKTYSLDQIAEAHRYVDTERKRGNVVVKVSNYD